MVELEKYIVGNAVTMLCMNLVVIKLFVYGQVCRPVHRGLDFGKGRRKGGAAL